MSVSMYPGAMAFTLMPLDAHSLESAFVRPATPCLAAAYAGTVRPPEGKSQLEDPVDSGQADAPWYEIKLAMLMIFPRPRGFESAAPSATASPPDTPPRDSSI